MTMNIYTDASISDINRYAAIGYIILKENDIIAKRVSVIKWDHGTDSAEAEAIVMAATCSAVHDNLFVKEINVHTDSQLVAAMYNRNYELATFVVAIKRIMEEYWHRDVLFNVRYVKGHSNDPLNEKVHRMCYWALRDFLVKNRLPLTGDKKTAK